MGKKEKYGSYLFKIGYLDIRQKIDMPKKRRLNNGEIQTISGKVEVFVYHGKNKASGPFNSHSEAIKSAETLLTEGYKFNKNKK
tara:strand:- start:116 stop:367 length:252 start_codon:yes stop_codon:yes gene_type:complete